MCAEALIKWKFCFKSNRNFKQVKLYNSVIYFSLLSQNIVNYAILLISKIDKKTTKFEHQVDFGADIVGFYTVIIDEGEAYLGGK